MAEAATKKVIIVEFKTGERMQWLSCNRHAPVPSRCVYVTSIPFDATAICADCEKEEKRGE